MRGCRQRSDRCPDGEGGDACMRTRTRGAPGRQARSGRSRREPRPRGETDTKGGQQTRPDRERAGPGPGPPPPLLGAPQRRDQAQVTLGRPPRCLSGSRLARAIPDRLLEAGSLGGVWEPLKPGGQATRRTADRVSAPAHNYPPAPAGTANELGFDPQHHSRPQRDCLAPAGRVRGGRAAESGPGAH